MKINNNLIPSIPDLPSELYVAHLQEKLAIFIGAGVSRLAGCESWEVLAANLLSICREKKLINYYEEEKKQPFKKHHSWYSWRLFRKLCIRSCWYFIRRLRRFCYRIRNRCMHTYLCC